MQIDVSFTEAKIILFQTVWLAEGGTHEAIQWLSRLVPSFIPEWESFWRKLLADVEPKAKEKLGLEKYEEVCSLLRTFDHPVVVQDIRKQAERVVANYRRGVL